MKNNIKFLISVIVAFSIMLLSIISVSAEATFIENLSGFSIDKTEYKMNKSYDYTVFNFIPEEVGVYEITSENLIGIVGYHWINETDVTEEIVCNNTIEWECNAVGQGIYVAVKGDGVSKTAIVNLTRKEIEIELPIERTPYEKQATVTPFVFKGNYDLYEFVDVFDDADTAVLGDDGFYHLNSADGPVIYVNLYDTYFVDLHSAVDVGQLVSTVFEGDKHVATIDYNTTFTEYYEAADKETGLYPLTIDLIEIYKKVGENENNKWYGDDSNVYYLKGSNVEDGWMFACMYTTSIDSDVEEDKDDSTSTPEGDKSVTTTDTPVKNDAVVNDEAKSPVTGDNTLSITIAMLLAAAATFGLKTKK